MTSPTRTKAVDVANRVDSAQRMRHEIHITNTLYSREARQYLNQFEDVMKFRVPATPNPSIAVRPFWRCGQLPVQYRSRGIAQRGPRRSPRAGDPLRFQGPNHQKHFPWLPLCRWSTRPLRHVHLAPFRNWRSSFVRGPISRHRAHSSCNVRCLCA
jgi:hypothetical protein